MNDNLIIELYFKRSEDAISETSKKYGNYCKQIAYNILRNAEDASECENDTYLKVWNSVPPQKPKCLKSFVGRITRNLALDRYDYYTAEKRRGCIIDITINELADCIPSSMSEGDILEGIILKDTINSFLEGLDSRKRSIFILRYWYFYSIKEISQKMNISQSSVKVSLYRCRTALKEALGKEDVEI